MLSFMFYHFYVATILVAENIRCFYGVLFVCFGGVSQEASTFIDVCSSPLGPAGFLVSLHVGEGRPAKAIQAVDGAPRQRHGQSV